MNIGDLQQKFLKIGDMYLYLCLEQVYYKGKYKDLYSADDGRFFVRYKRAYREIDIDKYEQCDFRAKCRCSE